jgi:outer membrane protein, heavy metal efflux system
MSCRRLIIIAGPALFLACASHSTAQDASRVRENAQVSNLPNVVDQAVDAEPDREATRLLKAPLNAEDAVRCAMLNNRSLRAKLRELGVARGEMIQAGVLPNPTVELELLPERNSQFALRVEFELTQAFLASQRGGAAREQLEASRFDVAGDVVELGFRTRAAFYRVQAATQKLQTGERWLDAQAAARDAMRALRDAGNVNELELATQETTYEKSRLMVARLDLELLSARETLSRILGVHGLDNAWKVQGKLAIPEAAVSFPDRLEAQVIARSLERRAKHHHMEALAKAAGATKMAGLIPDVALDVHGLQGDPTSAQESNWRLGAGISVRAPFFDRKQGASFALQAQFDAELERYYGLAVDLRSSAREMRGQLQAAEARVRTYRETIMPAQKRVTEQTMLQYNAMQVSLFQLLAAKRDELAAELSYVDELQGYWTTRAAFDALLTGKRVNHARSGSEEMMSSDRMEASPAGGH